MSEEEWMPHPTVPGYEVSSLGRVASSKRGHHKLICIVQRRSGYCYATLYHEAKRVQCRVHAAVLEAFVCPRPSPEHQACHSDGNRANNRLYNLRWDTAKGNARDRTMHGNAHEGARHHKAKLDGPAVLSILESPLPYKELASLHGVSPSLVGLIKRGKVWKSVNKPTGEETK